MTTIEVITVEGMFNQFADRVKLREMATDEKNLLSLKKMFVSGVVECIAAVISLHEQDVPGVILGLIIDEWVNEIQALSIANQAVHKAAAAAK